MTEEARTEAELEAYKDRIYSLISETSRIVQGLPLHDAVYIMASSAGILIYQNSAANPLTAMASAGCLHTLLAQQIVSQFANDIPCMTAPKQQDDGDVSIPPGVRPN